MAMIAKAGGGDFEPCPEYTGRAVCVDVTPLKKVQTPFGDQEKFRFAFEIDEERAEGGRFCVWSSGFTLSLSPKANLRKFLRGWLGRDLTDEEIKAGFDVESMLHRPAFLVIVHEHKEGTTYANIASCTPSKTEPLEPSGKFVRAIDRQQGGGNGGDAPASRGRDESYKRTSAPAAPAASPSSGGGDWLTTKVHVGAHAGQELRELSEQAIAKLWEKWYPAAKGAPKTTADDRRLIAALEAYQTNKTGSAVQPVDSDF